MGIIIRQSIKGTIVNYIGSFIGFLIQMFLVTQFLTTAEVGLVNIIRDTGLLLAMIGQFGTPNSAVKFFPYFRNNENKHNGFFFYLIVLPLIGFLLVAIFFLIFQVPIKNYYSAEAQEFVTYFYWLLPLAFFMIYQGVFETYSSILLRIVVPKFVREILVRVLTALIYLLYAFKFINLDWLITGLVSVYAIAALINLFYVVYLGHVSLRPNFGHARKPLRKSILYFTLYMIAAAIGSNVVAKIDVLMIGGMMGLAWTGIYNIAFFMAAIVEMPARSLESVAKPIAAEYFKRKDTKSIEALYKKIALNQLIAASLVFTLVWINIDNIFAIIPNGENYVEGKWVVFFMGLGNIINSTFLFGNSLLSISKHYHYTLFFVFFLSGITILGNYLLIPLLGISGTAVASMLSFIAYNVCMLFLVRWKIRIMPFSTGLLKIIVILIIIFLGNYFWIKFNNPYIDGIVRSLLWGGGFLLLVIIGNISEDINKTMSVIWKKAYSLLTGKQKGI